MNEAELKRTTAHLINACADGTKGNKEIEDWARVIVDRNPPDVLAVLMAGCLLRIKADARELLRRQCPCASRRQVTP